MCGIFGYIGTQDAQPVLIEGLHRLDYRGYEGAGVATMHAGRIHICKTAGTVDDLAGSLQQSPLSGSIGIAHTRWPTHGGATVENAHPHTSMDGRITLVHNGKILNHAELRARLERTGVRFASETDTEVLVHRIAHALSSERTLASPRSRFVQAVQASLRGVQGSYAIAVMWADEPDSIAFARNGSELAVGFGPAGDAFVASDPDALRGYADRFIRIEDGEVGCISRGGYLEGLGESTRRIRPVPAGPPTNDKNGYPHFMIKEIMEQPEALAQTIRAFTASNGYAGAIELGCQYGCNLDDVTWFQRTRFVIVGCGTSYHAGLAGKRYLERLARIPTEVALASEYPGSDPLLGSRGIVIGVSQSGETADTLMCLRFAKERGAKVVAVTNKPNSAIADLSDVVIGVDAGLEIAVASTKAFTCQVLALGLLAARVGIVTGRVDGPQQTMFTSELKAVVNALATEGTVRSVARRYSDAQRMIVIGRGLNAPLALEGALKLKEVAYVDAHGFPAGELKHGTIALVEHGTPVIAIVPQDCEHERMVSHIEETLARGARIIALATEGDPVIGRFVSTGRLEAVWLPRVQEAWLPIVGIIPLQLLAYHLAVVRGYNPDRPRNLAKSVTVE